MMRGGVFCVFAAASGVGLMFGQAAHSESYVAASYVVAASETGSQSPAGNVKSTDKSEPTPEEKMQARFPQPAKVEHLIGLPVLDANDSTIGYVRNVFRTPDGKVKLIVPYGERFGWAKDDSFLARGRRPVAVPIEAVTILARQINAIDMDRNAFAAAPTWQPGESSSLPNDATVKIGLGRR